MLRITSLIFALLVSWNACAQVPLTGAGKGAPGGGTVTFAITFGSSQEDATSQTSYSIPSVGIGSADPNRYVVVAICIRSGAAITTPTVTIGGAAATKVIDQSVGVAGSYSGLFETNSIFSAGTTATIAISGFGAAAARAAVQGYSVVTATGATPSGGAISAMTAITTTESATIAVPTNGEAIGTACSSANLVPISVTTPVSGISVDKDAVIGASTTTTFSMHDTVTRSGSTLYTFSSGSSFAASTSAAVIAAWAP